MTHEADGGPVSRTRRGRGHVTASSRREFAAALAAAALGAALVLFAGAQTWAEVVWQRHPALPPTTIAVGGGDAAPLAPAAGLVLLAAAAALLAVRGAGRAVLGVVMVLAGAGAAWASGRVLTGGDVLTDQLAALGVTTGDYTRDVVPAWPVVAVVGGLLGIAAGLLAVVRGRRWPAMGRRYERPGGPAQPPARPVAPATDEQRAQSAWTALDRGEDPTEEPGSRPS
jgi:uncharacterized membrane protein (TIGR02234 family)